MSSNNEENNINITFEILYELLRLEKSRPELQELPKDFNNNIQSYLKNKNEILNDLNKEANVFASNEKDRIQREFLSAKKIIEKVYELRENKIIELALNKSRMPQTLIDMKAFSIYEKNMLKELITLFDKHRNGVLYNILSLKEPKVEDGLSNIQDNLLLKSNSSDAKTKKIRLLKALPKFIWTDLKEYGPFEKGDVAVFPIELASSFLKKGLCETF